ncbi:MAG TPA: GNAT family N-acetyltransferase [Symbiobacteriaceae bacterium]|jgi:GNAT superfamily N-acetyltransferase|nr:GNAT family N-acetyltransferase [Symbiobacteriaceae bacterium]
MPLVQAKPGQESQLAGLLAREPLYNLFPLANLASGIGPDLEVWVGETGGLLMRRRSRWMVDAGPEPTRFDFAGAAAVIDAFSHDLVQNMTGRPAGVDPLYAALRRHQGVVYEQYFAALAEPPAPMPYPATIRPASAADLDQLTALYATAGDLSRPRSAVEAMLPTCWVAEKQGEIVSSAYVIAQTEQAAMVGGVYTPPFHRQSGYASALVHAISVWLLAQGRKPCLFYHNPNAGRIYLRLGYRPLGDWRMVKF